MNEIYCSRCGRKITKVIYINGKSYGTECARFILKLSPKSLIQKEEIANRIYQDMLNSNEYEFKIKKLPLKFVKKHFPISKINEGAICKLKDRPDASWEWKAVHSDPIVCYLVAQKMKIKVL